MGYTPTVTLTEAGWGLGFSCFVLTEDGQCGQTRCSFWPRPVLEVHSRWGIQKGPEGNAPALTPSPIFRMGSATALACWGGMKSRAGPDSYSATQLFLEHLSPWRPSVVSPTIWLMGLSTSPCYSVSSCVALGKLLSFSVLPIPCLKMGITAPTR